MSKFLKWIVNIILLAGILVASALLIPPYVGITTIIVDDVDMATNLNRGSVTYGISKDLAELKEGDDIIIIDDAGEYVYRLNSIDVENRTGELEDIKSTDGKTRSEELNSEVSSVLLTVPFIGYVAMAMKSTEGLIIIGLSIIFVIILFILAELWKKDKDEDDEDEDEDDESGEGARTGASSVDMSAQILEEVSSEIGSEISDVLARDTDEAKVVEAFDSSDNNHTKEVAIAEVTSKEGSEALPQNEEVLVQNIGGAISEDDSQEKSEADKLADELKSAISEHFGDEHKEESLEVMSEVSQEAKVSEAKANEIQPEAELEVVEASEEVIEAPEEAIESSEEVVEVSEEADSEEQLAESEEVGPVELAIPTLSAEELLERAKEAGDKPVVKTEEHLGITILDYSNIL